MGTRSALARKINTGYEWIYCHWDGYPENQLPLLQNYDTEEKIDQLIALKSLSYLGKEIGKKQNFDKPTNKDWCLSYYRDRNEDVNSHKVYTLHELRNSANRSSCEYLYIYEDYKWKVDGL